MRVLKTLSSWLTDIRKVALIASVTAALSLISAGWNSFPPTVLAV